MYSFNGGYPKKNKLPENQPKGVFCRFYKAIQENRLRYRHYLRCGFLKSLYNQALAVTKDEEEKIIFRSMYMNMCKWCKNSKIYDTHERSYIYNRVRGKKRTVA